MTSGMEDGAVGLGAESDPEGGGASDEDPAVV